MEVWSHSFALAFASATDERKQKTQSRTLRFTCLPHILHVFLPPEHKPGFSDLCVICQLNLVLWFLRFSLSFVLVFCTSVQSNSSCPTSVFKQFQLPKEKPHTINDWVFPPGTELQDNLAAKGTQGREALVIEVEKATLVKSGEHIPMHSDMALDSGNSGFSAWVCHKLGINHWNWFFPVTYNRWELELPDYERSFQLSFL